MLPSINALDSRICAAVAARPERRPRVPGGAWSEGHLYAAADSDRPTQRKTVKEPSRILIIIRIVLNRCLQDGHCESRLHAAYIDTNG